MDMSVCLLGCWLSQPPGTPTEDEDCNAESDNNAQQKQQPPEGQIRAGSTMYMVANVSTTHRR